MRVSIGRWLTVTGLCLFFATPAQADVRNVLLTVSDSDQLRVFTANTGNEDLTSVGTVSTGDQPQAVVMSTDRRHAYVANQGSSDSISVFDLNVNTGVATPGSTPSVSTGGVDPRGLAISPDGKFLYVTNSGSDSIAGFSIANDGTLSMLSGFPITVSGVVPAPRGIAMTSNGNYLYVVNPGTNTIQGYSRDTASGALTANGSPVATGSNPNEIAYNPISNYLAITNSTGDSVSVFSVNTSNGTLTPAATINDGGATPTGIAFSPLSGQRMAYLRGASNAIMIGNIVGGSFSTFSSPFSIAGGSSPVSMAYSPSGSQFYVSQSAGGGGSQLRGYSSSPSGLSMAELPTSPEVTGLNGSGFHSIIVGTDASPSADFTYETKPVGEATTFTSTSTDVDGTINTYDWSITGVGNPLVVNLPTSSNSTASYTFTQAGTYRVRLALADNEGCGGAVYNGQMLTCFGASSIEKTIVITDPPSSGTTTTAPPTESVSGGSAVADGSTGGSSSSTTTGTTTSSTGCAVSVIGGDSSLKKSLNVNRRLRLFFNVPNNFYTSSNNYFSVTNKAKLKKGKVKSKRINNFLRDLKKGQIRFLLFTLDGKTIGKDATYPYKVKIPASVSKGKKHTLVAKAIRRKRPGIKQGKVPARALRFKISDKC